MNAKHPKLEIPSPSDACSSDLVIKVLRGCGPYTLGSGFVRGWPNLGVLEALASDTQKHMTTFPISNSHDRLYTLPNVHKPPITLKMADQEPAAPVAIFKKRGAKSKANLRKRPATPPPASDSDSDAFSSSEDEAGHRIKRRKKTAPSAAVTASSRNDAAARHGVDEAIARETIFEADRASAAALDTARRDATKGAEWFDEQPDNDNGGRRLDAKGLLGSTRAMPAPAAAAAPDGTYKGLRNQTSYIQRNPDAPSRTVGPVKAPTNIRTITITDMAPDVCKDYKQTGFCGFGDVCFPFSLLPLDLCKS